MANHTRVGVDCEDKIRQTIVTTKNAHAVRVLLGDDVIKTIVLGHSRRRASTFVETLAKIGQWSSLDVLDKKGDVIAIVANDGEPGPVEELGPGVRAAGELARFDAMARIMGDAILRGQREVMSYRAREIDGVLGQVGAMVREVTGALRTLNEAHAAEREALLEAGETRALIAAQEATADAIAAAPPDADVIEQVTKLLGAIPQVAPLLPLVLNAIRGPAAKPRAAAPRNGAAKPPAGD